MNGTFWAFHGSMLVIAAACLIAAALNGDIPNQKRRVACEKVGGVYLYREGVCIRRDLVIQGV